MFQNLPHEMLPYTLAFQTLGTQGALTEKKIVECDKILQYYCRCNEITVKGNRRDFLTEVETLLVDVLFIYFI